MDPYSDPEHWYLQQQKTNSTELKIPVLVATVQRAKKKKKANYFCRE